MENNEQVVDETTNTAPSADETENTQGQEETKDWKAEALKFKAIAERKEKKLQEFSADGTSKEDKPLKNNQEQNSPTMEDLALVSKGHSLEELEVISKVAKIEGISKTEAAKTDFVISKIEAMRQDATVQANSMPPSTGSSPTPRVKTPGQMTDEEHRAYAEAKLAKAINK